MVPVLAEPVRSEGARSMRAVGIIPAVPERERLWPRHGNGCVLARLGRVGENNAFLNLLDGSLRSLRLTPTHVASKRQVIFFQQPFSKWHPEAGGPRKRIHLMTPLFPAQSESGP